MPLLHSIISNSYELYLWQPTEPLEELYTRANLSEQERQQYGLLKHDRRRKEYLCSRMMAIEFFGCQIGYLPSGCPVAIKGRFSNISVSHTHGCVALIGANKTVGIDVEALGRNFSKVASRFINFSEEDVISMLEHDTLSRNTAQGLIWCAKEAVYKSANLNDVDFKNHIIIDDVITETLFLSSKCYDSVVLLHYFFCENFMCVYTL